MARPSLRVAKKPQQQAGQVGICMVERTRRGTKKWSPRGTSLTKNNHSQEMKDVHGLVKNQTSMAEDLGIDGEGIWNRSGIIRNTKQAAVRTSSQKPGWPDLKPRSKDSEQS